MPPRGGGPCFRSAPGAATVVLHAVLCSDRPDPSTSSGQGTQRVSKGTSGRGFSCVAAYTVTAALAASSHKAPAGAEAMLRRLEWTVLRRLDGLLQGDYRTLLRGTGMDLADLREYQHHDDVRHIDWNVTARLQQPHVRVFTEDREMNAWFLLDLSPSMDFGSGEQRKRQVSAEFVAVLARLLTRHGNRVGAMLYGAGVDAVIPARGGRQHVLQLLHTLQTRPETPDNKNLGTTRLQDLLDSAANLVRRRSTIFVLSDFIKQWPPCYCL